MLPLWIIDLRNKSDRRDEFQRLVGQIDHVSMSKAEKAKKNDATQSIETDDVLHEQTTIGDNVEDISHENVEKDMTIKEMLEELDKQEAERKSIISGNYWKYSSFEVSGLKIELEQECPVDKQDDNNKYLEELHNLRKKATEETANLLYQFQSNLVREGQDFILELRKSNVQPDLKINIVVLGDITEDLTRIVFPSIATIIQKEKGRLLPNHIHQGMEIIGMLFIPSNINTLNPNIRKSMQRTLKEIDMQHNLATIRGYDHVMLYQDVQNRTECHYPLMNDKQIAQYLAQCIIHLYLACNVAHPLLSGTASADVFYFSMGAASVCYDTENEDLKGINKISIELIRNFKSDGDSEKAEQNLSILKDDEFIPDDFFIDIRKIDSEADIDTPSPHPIRNFLTKYLKRYYYNLYLRFFTKNLMQRIVSEIESKTRVQLEQAASKSRRLFVDAKKLVFERIPNIIEKLSSNDGGLPTIARLFKEMQEKFSRHRQDIPNVAEQKVWRQIDENGIPPKLKDSFMEYHDAYRSDLKGKTGGRNQLELKKQAVKELNAFLSNESTMLSRICRSVLLGIVFALALVPILHFLSPHFVNIGHIRRFASLWSIGLFFIPAICQVFVYFRYNRKKMTAINKLRAIYLHDAYARVANRIETEINTFYDKMTALADRYIDRCNDIRKELGKGFEEIKEGKPLFPETTFNQPLIGGEFGKEKLLPEQEADDCIVQVSYVTHKLRELGKMEYFLIINQNRNEFATLFKDVDICENLIRRVKENGEEELVTKEQQESEQQDKWEKHLNDFHKTLHKIAKETILPRENSTIGEKLMSYCSSTRHKDVLRPMIGYAATNGEITSSADLEFTDAKANDKQVEECISPLVASATKQIQIDKYNNVYRKYIFITRWRCFDHFNLNRILPTEDFDERIRRQRVWDAEQEAKNPDKKRKEMVELSKLIQKRKEENKNVDVLEAIQRERTYEPRKSTLLLWALCPDDSSSEWFQLIDVETFNETFEDKEEYRRILNQND